MVKVLCYKYFTPKKIRIVRGGHELDFSKSNLDPIQIQINGLDLKSKSILTRSHLFGFFKNPFKVDSI